jgi:hydrogenase-4 component F
MRLLALCLLPAAVAAAAAPLRRGSSLRPAVLVAAAAAHTALTATLWWTPAAAPSEAIETIGWLGVDALGLVVLTVTSVLFLASAVYAVGYLRLDAPRGGRVFVSCLLAFLTAASVVALSQHLAMLWVGMEAATLSVAPLIFHRRDRRSLAAAWKYLVISSVAIALALLGIFFLATAQTGVAGRPLLVPDLVAGARALQPAWLRAAFVFLLVGFGTKMGLAPMHTWKPDTYREAPGLVSGLMAGALTSCAFLGVARITQVTMAAGLGWFVQPPLIGFGLLSLAVAAAFVIGQRDLERLLAYSSVEHMGLLALGLGLGGFGAYGSVLHLINNGLIKGWLFLVAGNVVLATGGSASTANRGLARRLPVSGLLLLLGLFAVTGSPPFGLFQSELTLLRAAFAAGHPAIAMAMALLLALIFAGMAALVLEMTLAEGTEGGEGATSNEVAEGGEPAPGAPAPPRAARESRWLLASPLALAALVLMLGFYIPGPLRAVLARAAAALGGGAP